MEDILQNEYIVTIYSSMIYIGLVFLLFYIGKLVYGLFHKTIDVKSELVFKDNFAFAIAHTGYFIGLLIALGGVVIGETRGLQYDVLDISVYGLISIILLNISILINEKLILNKFSVHKEIIEDQNPGTGVIEAANAIAAGLILMGAVTGYAENFKEGILSMLIFWLLGQVSLFIIGKYYSFIVPYDVHKEVEKDNVAAGLGFAGALVAIGILICSAIYGKHESLGLTTLNVFIEVIIGLIFLPIARYFTDKVLLPGQNLTDEIVNQEKPNIGAGLIEAFAYIGSAILITWCI